jgi:hypothetical protein
MKCDDDTRRDFVYRKEMITTIDKRIDGLRIVTFDVENSRRKSEIVVFVEGFIDRSLIV